MDYGNEREQRVRQEAAGVLGLLPFRLTFSMQRAMETSRQAGEPGITRSVACTPGCVERKLRGPRSILPPSMSQELGSCNGDGRWIDESNAALLLLCFLHRESKRF